MNEAARCLCGHSARRHTQDGYCTVYSKSRGECSCTNYDDGYRSPASIAALARWPSSSPTPEET